VCTCGQSQILITSQHVSNGGSMEATTSCEVRQLSSQGQRGNFLVACARPAPLRYYVFFRLRPQLPKKYRYRAHNAYHNISGSTIFKFFKACGCWTAQLLGGSHRNLLIVSWVTPTPGCTANFPGNRCSQPRILPPFHRSGQELPVEYRVEAVFINFSVSTAKNVCRQGPGSGYLGESPVKATTSQQQYRNHLKITL
jgi:hypothetical protein